MNRAVAAVLVLVVAGCSAVPVAATTPARTAPNVTPASALSDVALHPGAKVERAARRAAARFVRAYLRLTYDQGGASRNVTTLVGARPDVPVAIRRLHPRVTRISFEWTAPGEAIAVATIEDGGAPYPVTVRLSRRRGSFRVVGLDP